MKALLSNSVYRFLALPVLLLGLVLIVRSPVFTSSPDLYALAVTADLLLTIPVIWFLLIRKTRIPNITTVPVLIAGLVAGFFILPPTHHQYLELFRDVVLPFIELSVLGYIAVTVTRTVKRFREERGTSADFYSTLRATLSGQLSGFALEAVVMEISVIYYGFFAWKKRNPATGEYSYHRESGGTILWVLILFLVAVETVVFHLLITQWSVTAAWIFSGLSLYSGMQVLGIFKAAAHRPILLLKDSVRLRYGLMNEVDISYDQIAEIAPASGLGDQEEYTPISPLGQLENQNIQIILRNPAIMRGFYGIKKKTTRLAFHADQPEAFIKAVEKNLVSDS